MALDLRGLSQQDQLQKAADYAGVDPSVFSGMSRVESGDGTNMLSPAGARGWFGIMPTTQKTWEGRTGRQYDPNDYGDGLTIKRLQLVPRTDKIRVMSDNARYTDYELRREEVRVYGRVVAWFQWRG